MNYHGSRAARPYKAGRVTLIASLRIAPQVRDRVLTEAASRDLSNAAFLATIVEIMHRDNLFGAVLDDDKAS